MGTNHFLCAVLFVHILELNYIDKWLLAICFVQKVTKIGTAVVGGCTFLLVINKCCSPPLTPPHCCPQWPPCQGAVPGKSFEWTWTCLLPVRCCVLRKPQVSVLLYLGPQSSGPHMLMYHFQASALICSKPQECGSPLGFTFTLWFFNAALSQHAWGVQCCGC